MLREEGLAGVARYALRRLYLKQHYYVYSLDLAELPDAPVALPAGLEELRAATQAERRGLVRHRVDLGAASYWDAVQPEATCYVGIADGDIAAVHWVSPNEEPNDLVLLRPGDFVIGPCVTAPDFRGRGLYPAMILWICDQRRRTGARRAYMVVSTENSPSIRGIEKAGFRRSAEAVLIRWGGLQRVTRTPIPV